MFKIGTTFVLKNENTYKIEDFKIAINKNGNYDAFLSCKDLNDSVIDYPVWMIVDLMNSGEIYHENNLCKPS